MAPATVKCRALSGPQKGSSPAASAGPSMVAEATQSATVNMRRVDRRRGSTSVSPWYPRSVPDSSKAPSSRVLKTLPAIEATSTLSRAVVQAVKAPHRPVLVVISGNEMGARKPVDRSLLIGRDPGCDFVLTDGLVSSRHAMLEDRGDAWALVDLGSTNGTCVNGEKGKEFVLTRNDKIVFGRTVARFEMQDELEQAYDELVEKLLNVDDLSGLYVRRKFDAELAVAIEAARAEK